MGLTVPGLYGICSAALIDIIEDRIQFVEMGNLPFTAVIILHTSYSDHEPNNSALCHQDQWFNLVFVNEVIDPANLAILLIILLCKSFEFSVLKNRPGSRF
jgi:hypothetical protein